MKNLGYILLLVGFLGASYFTALDPNTIQWQWFVPGVVLGGAGVIMVKMADRAIATHPDTLAANRRAIEGSLDRVIADLEKLEGELGEIRVDRLPDEIDKRLRVDLLSFAEARMGLIHMFDMQTYADVMSAFAAGERYVNRVWSAAADGYEHEAHAYVPKALEQFQQAHQRLERARAESPAT